MKAAFWRGRRLRWPARTLMFHSMGIMSVAFLGAIMGIMSGQMGAVLGSDWLPRIESVWSEGRGARGAASGGRARGGGDSGDTTSGGGPDEHKNKDSTSAGPAADEDAACDEGDEGSCAPTTTTTTIRPIPGRTRPTPTPTTPTLEQQSEPAAAPCDPTESDDEDAGCPPRDPLASIAALEKEAILSNVRHGTMEHAATASASETRTATASASERPLASSTPSSETPQTSSALQGRKESSLESAGGPEPEDSVLVTIDAEGSSTVEDSVEENGLGNAEGSSTVSEKVHDVPSDAQLYLDGLGRTKTYAKNENEQLYLDSQTAIWTKYRMAEQVAEDAEDFHTAAMNVQLRRRGGRRGPSSRGAYLEDDEEPGTYLDWQFARVFNFRDLNSFFEPLRSLWKRIMPRRGEKMFMRPGGKTSGDSPSSLEGESGDDWSEDVFPRRPVNAEDVHVAAEQNEQALRELRESLSHAVKSNA